MTELSLHDLELETGDLLPDRRALGLLDLNVALIGASNSSTAVNLLTLGGVALSSANQGIWVFQHA